MGFTRHLRQHNDLTDHEWERLKTAALQCMMTHVQMNKSPIVVDYVGNECIYFNGVEPEAYETFDIHRGQGYRFCKTGREPYDHFVAATMLMMTWIAPLKFYVRADGDDEENYMEEWAEGLRVINEMIKGPNQLTGIGIFGNRTLTVEYTDQNAIRLIPSE